MTSVASNGQLVASAIMVQGQELGDVLVAAMNLCGASAGSLLSSIALMTDAGVQVAVVMESPVTVTVG